MGWEPSACYALWIVLRIADRGTEEAAAQQQHQVAAAATAAAAVAATLQQPLTLL